MNLPRFKTHVFVAVLAALLALPAAATTTAQDTSTPAATPEAPDVIFSAGPAGEADISPFRFELDAGGTTEATLVVANDAGSPIELRSYAADVTTAVNGGYQVLPEPRETGDVAGWLTVPTAPYTLDPGEERELPVGLVVPEGTPPGEYMAALATETVESASIAGTDTFRQVTRKVSAVVITVPGPVSASFELGAPSIEIGADTTTVIVPIENTGNARVRPQGAIVVADDTGNPVVSIPVAMDSVYAWHETTMRYTLPQPLPEGAYTVSVELVDDASGATAELPGTIVVAAVVAP